MLRRRRAEGVFEYSVGFGERFIHVAGAQLEMITDIRLLSGFDVREIGESLRRSMLLMYERRLRLHRFEHIVRRRQRFVIHLDKL